MASSVYPGAYDPPAAASDSHNDVDGRVRAVQSTLGLNPQGTSATVVAALGAKLSTTDASAMYTPARVITAAAGSDITSTLAGLISAASPGDRIVFPNAGPWTISGTVLVNKRLSFEGPPGKAVIDCRLPVATVEKMFDVQADGVAFRDLIFDGTNAPAGTLAQRKVCIFAGHNVTRYQDLEVRGCVFRNLTRKGVVWVGNSSLESDYAIYTQRMDGVRISDCHVSEISGVGFFVNLCTDIWVQRNTVEMIAASDCLYPIHLGSGNVGAQITHNVVRGGTRRGGGAIDVMSISAFSKDVHVTHNIVDNCGGGDSGTAVLRFLSVENGSVADNIVRNIATAGSIYIYLDHRDSPAAQPGPKRNIVRGNILVAGAADQRGIDVRNDNAASVAADVLIESNVVDTDGTNSFGAGIRLRDISRGKVRGNTVVYKFSAGTIGSWGIEVAGVNTTMVRPVVESNHVDCQSSVSSRGIFLTGSPGSVSKPVVRDNVVQDWADFGIRADAFVADLTLTGNTFSGPSTGTAVSSASTGSTQRRGNRLGSDPIEGAFTIPAAGASVTITTTEVQAGDRVLLTPTGTSTTDKPVKVVGLTAGTSFIVRTVDQAAVTNAMTGTWAIDH